jgi:hypothetical protein
LAMLLKNYYRHNRTFLDPCGCYFFEPYWMK